MHERAELRALVRGVRQQLHPADTTFEILTDSTFPTPDQKVSPPENAPDDPTATEKPDDSPPDKDAIKVPPPPKPKDEPKPKVEAPKPKVEAPKPPEEKKAPPPPPPKPIAVPEVPVPVAPAPPPPPLPPADRRLAIKQNVDKDQPDNPNANRIADEANKTDEETMAQASGPTIKTIPILRPARRPTTARRASSATTTTTTSPTARTRRATRRTRRARPSPSAPPSSATTPRPWLRRRRPPTGLRPALRRALARGPRGRARRRRPGGPSTVARRRRPRVSRREPRPQRWIHAGPGEPRR